MRSAEVAHNWEKLRRKAGRTFSVGRFSYEGIPGLADGEIHFTSPITAICGPNGVSKTTFLRSLWATLDWQSASGLPHVLSRIGTARTCVEGIFRGAGYQCRLDAGASELVSGLSDEAEIFHIDTAEIALRAQAFANSDQAADLVEAESMLPLDAGAIALVSYLCGKQYETLTLGEVSDISPAALYATANDGAAEYNSSTMSLGELSVLAIIWKLQAIPKGSVVLIEEPETFLSPAAQTALINYLVAVSVDRKLSIIFTTHSANMVSQLKDDEIKFLFKPPRNAAKLASLTSYDQMRQSVGLTYPKNKVVFIEDRAAKEFLKLLIARYDYKLALEVCYGIAGGDSKLTTLLHSIPPLDGVSIVGVYDGDIRGREGLEGGIWNYDFLPGEHAMEHQFRRLAQNETAIVAEKMELRQEDLETALAALSGVDDHDWFEELGRRFGVSYDQIMLLLFRIWLAAPGNDAHAQELVGSIKRKLAR